MIIVSSPKKIPDIKKEIKKHYNEIKEKTKWESFRKPSDLVIELGEAPEYYESFGVSRNKEKIVFGNWINNIKTNYTKEDLWESILIRESFALFIDDKYFVDDLVKLTNIFLNIAVISYIQDIYQKKGTTLKISNVRVRISKENTSYKQGEENPYNTIESLLKEIINQNISYKLIIDTYIHFIDGYNENDFDIEELKDDFHRYISQSSMDIVAPIYLKSKTAIVLKELIRSGFKTSTFKIAENLEVNQSTVSRQLTKIMAKFYAKWRAVKNWGKIGLNTYMLIIRLQKNNKKKFDYLTKELLKIDYISQIYNGTNEEYDFIYSVFESPSIVHKLLEKKLFRYQESRQLNSFELDQIINFKKKLALIDNQFKPNMENFRKLIYNEIIVNKITVWESSYFKNQEKIQLEEKDKLILEFLSIIKSNSLTSYSFYGVFVKQAIDFITQNGYSIDQVKEYSGFFNNLQNNAIERNLLDYSLLITLSSSSSNYLIIRLYDYPNPNELEKLLDDLSVFSNVYFRKSIHNTIITIYGLNYLDPLVDIIKQRITKVSCRVEIFSMKLEKWQYVPYSDLYDFQSKKWKIQR